MSTTSNYPMGQHELIGFYFRYLEHLKSIGYFNKTYFGTIITPKVIRTISKRLNQLQKEVYGSFSDTPAGLSVGTLVSNGTLKEEE